MLTTTSSLTPATHGLRVAASFNPFYDWSKGVFKQSDELGTLIKADFCCGDKVGVPG